MHRSRASAVLLLFTAACAVGFPAATGRQVLAVEVAASLKTIAVRGAREEIARNSDNAPLHNGIYLDTLVGPTPEEYLFEWGHPRAWLGAMIDARLVDGVFGVPARRSGLPRQAFAIEVGEPYPAGADTVEIVYDFCVRTFPVVPGSGAPASIWRDAFVPADTGWVRVRHVRAIAPTACTP